MFQILSNHFFFWILLNIPGETKREGCEYAIMQCYLVFDVDVLLFEELLNLLLEGDVILYVLEIWC